MGNIKDSFFFMIIFLIIILGFLSIPISHAGDIPTDDTEDIHLLSFYEDRMSQDIYSEKFSNLPNRFYEERGFLAQLVIELRIMNYLNIKEHGGL